FRQALDRLTDGAGQEGPAKVVKFKVAVEALPRDEREQAKTEIYELLLILAEAVARAPADTARLDHALRLLDRAGSLELQTLALAQRRADLLDRVGQKREAEQQRREAETLQNRLEKEGPEQERRFSTKVRRERAADYFLL